jgi:hypothetical protein
MTDWQRLVDLRERRRTIALEAMNADQRAAERLEDGARSAQAGVARCEDAKADHWQSTLAESALNVAQLCGAAAWSRALDGQIGAARAAFEAALEQARAGERALEASRERLRRAAGGVEKADRMRERTQVERRRADDLRLDATTEDFAAARWAAARRSV